MEFIADSFTNLNDDKQSQRYTRHDTPLAEREGLDAKQISKTGP